MSIDASDSSSGAGQMLFIPADQPNSIRAITKFKMIVVMINV